MTENYDIVICGASLGGTLAAYSACLLGKKVILLEKTKWIGGQLTSQAVPPDEHPWIETEGATSTYMAYRKQVRKYYIDHPFFKDEIKEKKEFCPASSEVSRVSHPPKLALRILNDMLSEFLGKNLTIYYEVEFVNACANQEFVESVTCKIKGAEITFKGRIFIDGTDTGDLLPLTNTLYRFGAEPYELTKETHAPESGNNQDAQPSVYTLAFANRECGNYVIEKPKEYDFFRSLMMPYDNYPIFSMFGPDSQTGKAKEFGMFENEINDKKEELFPLFNYRRIVCKSNFKDNYEPFDVTLLNWPQNDYFLGNLIENVDASYHDYMAKQLTLSFFYYLQTEAKRADGGIGYPYFELRYDYLGTEDGLSMAPYVRESRRIVPKFLITEEMIKKGSNPDFFDSIGVGSYPIDLHITTSTHTFLYAPSERFTIPLGAVIPVDKKNLLPASKNIGTTHLTNGCFRLHPVEWNIGESVGALASFVIDKGINPVEVLENHEYLNEFQSLLKNMGVQLRWNKD